MVDHQKARVALPTDDHEVTVETWDEYAFDLRKMSIVVDGVFIPTTVKEFDLALLLFRNLSKPLSRNYLMDAVWGCGVDATSRTLEAHISQLRTRLSLNPKGGFLLASVYRFGYRLERLSTWQRTAPRGVDRMMTG